MTTPFFETWEQEQEWREQQGRGGASGRPDRPVNPHLSLAALKAEVEALVESNPELAAWELRHLIRSQFPKVDAATITAALQSAQKRQAAPLAGYGPGDVLHDQQINWLLQDFIPAFTLAFWRPFFRRRGNSLAAYSTVHRQFCW